MKYQYTRTAANDEPGMKGVVFEIHDSELRVTVVISEDKDGKRSMTVDGDTADNIAQATAYALMVTHAALDMAGGNFDER